MSELPFVIEVGKPDGFPPDARWVELKLGGVTVFNEYVYDRDKDGERTEEQAKLNLLNLFAHRLKQVLEEE